jgi:Cu/Ag efflux protein CusF
MRTLIRSLLTLAAAIALTFTTFAASAADKKAPKDAGTYGKITAVDKDAKTITIAGKVIAVDDTTVITDSGKPAKLENLKVGTDATVATFKLGDKLTATSIKTGAVAAAVPTTKKKK